MIRLVNRAAIVCIVAAFPGIADSKPRKLTMKQVDSTNLHIANERGAIHWSADIAVALELRDDHKLVASATGWRKEHNLYVNASSSYNTDDETKFATEWTGTWAEAASVLRIELEVAHETCSRTKTTTGAKPEVLACKPARKQAKLVCTTVQIALEDLGATKRTVAAWSCQPGGSDDLGESPSWLFGKTTCIATSSGRMGSTEFRSCPP